MGGLPQHQIVCHRNCDRFNWHLCWAASGWSGGEAARFGGYFEHVLCIAIENMYLCVPVVIFCSMYDFRLSTHCLGEPVRLLAARFLSHRIKPCERIFASKPICYPPLRPDQTTKPICFRASELAPLTPLLTLFQCFEALMRVLYKSCK